MTGELVSVIIPVYNGEKYLDECLNSVLNQTYKNVEIILVDDCSTDLSAEICKKYDEKYDQVCFIQKEKNGGVSDCRICGLEKAKGEWVIYVDDDDTITQDCIECFINAGNSQDGIDIVSGLVGGVCAAGNREDVYHPFVESGESIIKRYFDDAAIITSHESKMYRMSLFGKVNVCKYKKECPVAYFDDIVITPVLFGEAKKVALLKDVYYLHREVKTSISRSGLLNSFYYDHIEAGNILLKYFRHKDCFESWRVMLSVYLKNILRIYCLMDYFNLDSDKKRDYEKRIGIYYKKYFPYYFRYGRDSFIKKAVLAGYGVMPEFWKTIVQKTYYRNYKRDHNL